MNSGRQGGPRAYDITYRRNGNIHTTELVYKTERDPRTFNGNKGLPKRKVMRRCKLGGSYEHIDSKLPINIYIKHALDKDYCTTPGPLLNVLQ